MNKVFIIAEAGVNHNGDIALAKKMVDAAVECKADAIKFQTFKAKNLVCNNLKKAYYQIINTGDNSSQLSMLNKLELTFDNFISLQKYCISKEIMFLSTPFDFESIDFLSSLNIPIWKIPSGEITNLPYLLKIAQTGKKIILSTGMSTIDEIRAALNILKYCDVSLLHCTTEYPCPFEDVNLKAIQTLKNIFNLEIGYSDHTMGIEIAVAAVAFGATIIEKHFTLDRSMEGPDHKASLEPEELAKMVNVIRNIEKAFGDGIKKPSKSEIKNIDIARKSIVAKTNIAKDDIFTEQNITVKRPGTGISPMKWFDIIGTKAAQNYNEDDLI